MKTPRAASITAIIILSTLIASPSSAPHAQETAAIEDHAMHFDKSGLLLPWTGYRDAIAREMEWYQHCPEHGATASGRLVGYPRFVTTTFMMGNYAAIARRPSTIPAMQNGMGIISYLKYWNYTGRKDARFLKTANQMADYLTRECLTPETGVYPLFPRSTGTAGQIPMPADCGSQRDHSYEIQPDKGAIAAYALLKLWEQTKRLDCFNTALHTAEVLKTQMRSGDAAHSPWPFRADFRTGTARGEISSNMCFILRLFDGLVDAGREEFKEPRQKLWRWIVEFQIPSANAKGELWAQFFEDHEEPDNRNSWAPLNLARYLLEGREKLDPQWLEHSRTLVEFTARSFTSVRGGVPVCGEQDYDREPWSGALSTYGAVLALYARAAHSPAHASAARQALNFAEYAIHKDGCPGDTAIKPTRGGWQEDAHTDVIHNYVDALTTFPEWVNSKDNRLQKMAQCVR
jgi:hypothetical protein